MLSVVVVHLPVGDKAGLRERVIERVSKEGERLIVVGDMNAKDEEITSLSRKTGLQEAKYAGLSWGVKHNPFYKDTDYRGPGLRKDRVLFGEQIWAEAHLIGQAKVFFEGSEFYMSDHFGVMAYADAADAYRKKDSVVARARRGHRQEGAVRSI